MSHLLVEALHTEATSSSLTESEAEPVKPKKQTLQRGEVIDTVSFLLQEMIENANNNFESLDEIPNKISFHAQKKPAISVKDYLHRFADNSNCQDSAFVYALIYLDRIGEKISEFELDSFNIHRFILLSLVAACKFGDDYYYKNSYYARIGGLSVSEFNKLEQEYLFDYTEFKLHVEVDTYKEYYNDLLQFNEEKLSDKKVL